MSAKLKKGKAQKSKGKKTSSINKTIVSILSVLFTVNGTVFTCLNVFTERQTWFSYVIIGSWFIGLILAFNSQKASIKWNRILGMVSVGVIAVSFLFFLIYNQVIHSSEGHAKLRNCKNNLYLLARIMELYKTDHKEHYPQNLDVLSEEGYLDKYMNNPRICPLNMNEYILQIDGWDAGYFTVFCPNEPQKHIGEFGPDEETTELYYSSLKKDIVQEVKPKQN